MTTYEKTSLSLPADLFEAISRAAQADDQSRSQKVAELIRLGLTARQQIDALYRENARLKQTIEDQAARLASAEASLKKLDPRDYLTGAAPGTAKLRDDLAIAEKARRQAEADAAEATRAAKQLRSKARELQERNAALDERCTKADEAFRHANAERGNALRQLQAERARKVPWYWRVTLPDIRFHRLNVGYLASHAASWRRGFLAAWLLVGLGLFLIPHQWAVMRYTAVAAMGTWGDIPKAAARLHGGPITGQDTLLQIYALVRAGDNPARLDACFRKSLSLTSQQPPVNCTILIPPEFSLYTDVVASGPHASTSRAVKLTERQRAALDRLDRKPR
jgi:hypothetical protein